MYQKNGQAFVQYLSTCIPTVQSSVLECQVVYRQKYHNT